MKPMRCLWAVTVASAALAGCGGGDDGDAGAGGPNAPGATGHVPASAAASPNALVRFLKGLATTEVAEPLQVGAFEPPRTDEAEPETLD